MNVKRFLRIALFLGALALCLVSCHKEGINDISITSVSLQSIRPAGLKAVNGVLLVEVHNPVMAFKVSEIVGSVRENETELAHFTAGEVQVDARSDHSYEVPFTGELTGQLNLLSVYKMLSTKDFSNFFVDISAKVTLRNGIGKTITREGMSLSSLIEGL